MAPRRKFEPPRGMRESFSGRSQKLYEEIFQHAWHAYGTGFGSFTREELAHNVGLTVVKRLSRGAQKA